MAHSIGLTLYNLAARPVADPAPWPMRPRGSLVWLHVPGPESRAAMLELARRLVEDDGVSVLVTRSSGPETTLETPTLPPTTTPPPTPTPPPSRLR